MVCIMLRTLAITGVVLVGIFILVFLGSIGV